MSFKVFNICTYGHFIPRLIVIYLAPCFQIRMKFIVIIDCGTFVLFI